jgi:uncharacterized protein
LRVLLGFFARASSRRPLTVLLLLALATAGLGLLASQQRVEADLTAFAPDTELNRAYERVQADFGVGGGSVQVIIDAGDGGDVLSPAGLTAANDLIRALSADERVAPYLGSPSGVAPPVISFATPLLSALEAQGVGPEALTQAQVDALAAQVYATPGASELVLLLSRDRDVASGTARGGLVVVQLDPALDENAESDAAQAVRQVVAEVGTGDLEVIAFNRYLLLGDLEGGLVEEMPLLLGLSMLLIIGILLFIFRTVLDVVLGLVGLVITITWMYGFGVLLGPDYLGVAGYFSQISIVVPVLLVGLGIDYAIHLTSRYREERAGAAAPDRAASVAILSVGGALVLATITTVVAFLTNVFTPVPPVRDFGMFTAVGVISAFIVMGLLVPSARSAIDRLRGISATSGAVTRDAGGTGPVAMRAVMARAALLTERAPKVTLAVAALVTVLAAVAASQVPTSFSQDDFIPEGSYADRALTTTRDLFGGDLNEQTYLLLGSDLAEPAAANAVLATERAIAMDVDPDLVRGGGGARVDVLSAPGLVARLAQLAANPPDPDFPAAQLTAALAADGWTADGFSENADVEGLYGLVQQALPGQLERVRIDDGALIIVGSTAGEERADLLRDQLAAAGAPLVSAGLEPTVVSEQLVLGETLQSLNDSQARSILITLFAALVLLVAYYGIAHRQPLLGLLTMVPSALAATWVIGSMWALGLSFNVLTSTIAALAIGIGVPYGIHITHRFVEDRRRYEGVDEPMRQTMLHTGGALAGSAVTTAAGFGVLVLASLTPIQQFGGVTALTIMYALVGGVLVQPSLLVLWHRWQLRREDRRTVDVEPAAGLP